MLDLEAETLRAVDTSDMMGNVLDLPGQVRRALAAAPDVAGLEVKPSRVLVVGMGGSAISGDYLAAWADAESAVPVRVSRAYRLPAWVDSQTLVLAFSYSGNTEETLASFVQAREKGAMLAAMSTGGRLEVLAQRSDVPFARVEADLQPRVAIGAAFTTAALLVDRLGLWPTEDSLGRAAKTLEGLVAPLHPDVSVEENEAKRSALALDSVVPAIYGAGPLLPAARRFANQLNENAKVLAWHGEMPEMNHNELVGWHGDDDLDRFAAVFLRDEAEHPQDGARYDFTADVIQKRGGEVIQHNASGETIPERLLSHTLTGDAVSVYLAALRGVDPTPVDIISTLKSRVGETGFAAGLE